MAEDLLRHGANQESSQAFLPMGTHDEQVGIIERENLLHHLQGRALHQPGVAFHAFAPLGLQPAIELQPRRERRMPLPFGLPHHPAQSWHAPA